MNSNKIKKLLTKGILLTTITGTLVCTGPNIISDNTTKVYALSNFETSKTKMINKLEKLYSKYNKKYYEEKDYVKLTSYYNSGVNELKNLSEKNSNSKKIEEVYKKYEEKMNKIKPSILVSYQKKQEKKVLKEYKSLIKNNSYSKNNSDELELIKDTSIEKIYKTKTKTKAKNIRVESINSLESVKTLLEEEKEDVIYYINTNKNISESDKKAIIERINSTNDIKVVESIGKEYNYGENEKVTIKDIEDRIKSLCKKYKAYTEDEIRCLVATANLDYIDDSDVYKAFNVKNDNELSAKADLFDKLMDDEYYNMSREWRYLYDHSGYSESIEKYIKKSIKYDDMVKFNELFINSKIKEYADQLFDLTNLMVKKNNTKLTGEEITEGVHAGCELGYYIFRTDEYKKYSEPLLYDFGDARLKGTSVEYVINKYICMASYYLSTTHRVQVCIPEDYQYQLSNYIDTLENPILKLTNTKVKTK